MKKIFGVFFVILLLFVSGCGSQASYEDGPIYIKSGCEGYAPHAFADLRREVRDLWWEDERPFTTGTLEVYCFDEMPEHSAGVYGSATWHGNGRTTIRIVKIPTLRKSAWIHELLHAHFAFNYGDGDSDHANGEGPWKEKHDWLVAWIMMRGLQLHFFRRDHSGCAAGKPEGWISYGIVNLKKNSERKQK